MMKPTTAVPTAKSRNSGVNNACTCSLSSSSHFHASDTSDTASLAVAFL